MDSEPICLGENYIPPFRCLSAFDLDAISGSDVPIPDNELDRLFAVRDTLQLDTETADPMFDRFVHLAKRLFNVPFAMVGLMDVNRMFLKSQSGLSNITEIPRNVAFCAYTILPHSCDVVVVEDASKDIRFMNNPGVLGPTKFRFYAGAAIVIDNHKVGTVCVFDTVPRHDFSQKDRMNLLDLGEAVSTLIKERKGAALSSDKVCAAMMSDMMHNVRTPLAAIDLASSILLESLIDEKPRLEKMVIKAIVEKLCSEKSEATTVKEHHDYVKLKIGEMTHHCKSLIDFYTESTASTNAVIQRDLMAAVGQLKVVVESSICLGQLIVEKAEKKSLLGASYTSCHVIKSITETRQTLVHMQNSADITWDINTSKFDLASNHICSPKVINFLLLNTVEQLINLWKTIEITVTFTSSVGDYEYESVHKILEDMPQSPGGYWHHGLLSIDISYSNEIDVQSRVNSFMPESHMNFYSRDQILKDCEGSRVHRVKGKTESQNYFLPCAIFIVDENSHSFNSLDGQKVPLPALVSPRFRTKSFESPFTKSIPSTKSFKNNNFISDCPGSTTIPTTTAGYSLLPPISLKTDPTQVRSPKNLTPKTLTPMFMIDHSDICEKSLRVLLVEDSVSIQKLMSRWLKSRGCDVTVAENGKVGLEFMRSKEYDVCFMDFLMPVMSGPDAMVSFYNWSQGTGGSPMEGDIPSVIDTFNRSINKEMLLVGMSANASDMDVDTAFQHGMHFYCPKPAETTMLTAILSMRKVSDSFEETLTLIGSHASGCSGKYSVIPTESRSCKDPMYTLPKQSSPRERKKITIDPGSGGGVNGWKLFKRMSKPNSRNRLIPVNEMAALNKGGLSSKGN